MGPGADVYDLVLIANNKTVKVCGTGIFRLLRTCYGAPKECTMVMTDQLT